MLTPRLKAKDMHFKNVNFKDPQEKFLIWLGEVILPKSNYLNKSLRGKHLLKSSIDELEYIAFKCKNCNDLLKKQSKYLYFIKLWDIREEEEIDEETFDELISEFI